MTKASEERAAILAKLNDIEVDIETSIEELSIIENNTGGGHDIADHNDTTATGAELDELTDGSETALHSHGGGFTSRVSAYLGSNQTITTGTWTVVTFDTELWDNNSEFDIATNKGRFTAKAAGYYHVSAAAACAAMSAGKTFWVTISKNGTTVKAILRAAFGTESSFLGVSGDIYLDGNTDYIEIKVHHDFGSDKTINGTDYNTYVDIYRFA